MKQLSILFRGTLGFPFPVSGAFALVEMFADGTIEKILAEYGLDPADALGGTAGE